MAINRLTTAMLRHNAHHGENLRFQHQRWENAWSYDKMVWSGQQYCGIHSKGNNATLSTTPVGEVQDTKGMVWESCTAVNQYRLQATGRGSRLDLWADSSARTSMCTTYISSNILGFPMLTEWATRVRYLQCGMNIWLAFREGIVLHHPKRPLLRQSRVTFVNQQDCHSDTDSKPTL